MLLFFCGRKISYFILASWEFCSLLFIDCLTCTSNRFLSNCLIFAGKHYWNYADNKVAYKKYLAVIIVEKKIKQDSIANATKKDTAVAKSAIKKDTLTKEQKNDKAGMGRNVNIKKI